MFKMTRIRLLVGIPIASLSFHALYNIYSDNSSSFFCVDAASQQMKLEQVQILVRHGARTTIKSQEEYDRFTNLDSVVWDKEIYMKKPTYVDIPYSLMSIYDVESLRPIDNHKKVLAGGSFGGTLTNKGHDEAYEFGTWLNDEYIAKHSLLSPVYDSNEVHVRSTLSERAILTGVGIMAGLYGKENVYKPIQIYSSPPQTENICPNWIWCRTLYRRFAHHWNKVDSELMELNNLMGLKENAKPFNYIEIFDIIAQRNSHGLFVPQLLLDREEEIRTNAMKSFLDILGRNVEELKPSIGSFVETVCCTIKNAITGACASRVVMYPSHDTTVVCFLSALGIFDQCWPPYCANVIIELYSDANNEKFIRLLYNRQVVILDRVTGEEFLPVEQFLKLLDEYRVNDWEDNCGNRDGQIENRITSF